MLPTSPPALLSGAPELTLSAAGDGAGGTASAIAWRDALAHLGPRGAAAAARGGFAVGLHDSARGSFLAVDGCAEHSLCDRVEADCLRFAVRADQLADDSPEIYAQAIYDYLYFHVIPSPRTVFAGVQRLPPGHCAWFEQGRLRVEPYWTPSFDATPRADCAALRDEFRALLERAVRRRLDGGKPACFLSGGTDSSTVAGTIGAVAGRPAASYSIGFDAEGYDELACARLAARHFGSEHHEYYVTPDDLVRSIGEVAASCDQPFGNSSVLPVLLLRVEGASGRRDETARRRRQRRTLRRQLALRQAAGCSAGTSACPRPCAAA